MVWAVADEADCACAGFSRSCPFAMADSRQEVQTTSTDRQKILIERYLRRFVHSFPLLGPVFQECYRLGNHSLALALVTVVTNQCILCAPLSVVGDMLDAWVRVIRGYTNDHARSVDFLARLLDLNLSIQDGHVINLGLGYNLFRSSYVWAPRAPIGPRRRVLGTRRTRAFQRLQPRLRGGNAGNGAGFAGFDGAGEVLSGVEELGSDDVDAVVRVFDDAGDVDAVGDVGAVADEAELFDEMGIVSGAGAVAEDGAGVVGDVSAAA